MMRQIQFVLAALLLSCAVPAAQETCDKKIAGFKLQDYRGAWHSLDDLRDSKLVVIAFLGNECPVARAYAPRFVELTREFQPKGVAFIGINSNQQDSITEIAHFARIHAIEFPLLKDAGNAVADQFGAKRTPEVFVLDGQRIVRYWGRIDDQYGIGYTRPKATRRDLADALAELLAGKPVTNAVVESEGCYIGRVSRQPAKGEVTYSKQVARVLQQRCVACHRPGQIAPFALTSYSEVAGWAETIREVIRDRRMPPWHANPKYGVFANDARMPEEEKQLVYEWVKNGAPEGDPRDLPEPVEFPEGWRIPQPDLVITMPKPFTVPATGVVDYQYFVVDPGFKEDKWVQAAEARAGNRAVVHHNVVFVQPASGQSVASQAGFGFDLLAASAPGMPPQVLPDGMAKCVPAGSKLVFQMHYTPNGSAESDQSSVGLVFADPKNVKKEVKAQGAINFLFRIPPGAKDHQVEVTQRFGQDTVLFSLMPHMHLRGKSFQFEANYPDGSSEILLDVPRYEFAWQHVYQFADPKLIPEGTKVRCVAHFDNSEDNLSNPDPTAPVTFGLQTRQEMMAGLFDTALAYQDLSLGPPRIEPIENGEFEVFFKYRPPHQVQSVHLAGTFNDWKTDAHALDAPDEDGFFTTRLTLKSGRYEYKFVLDGKTWKHDPGNRRQAGIYNNSVLIVGDSR